MLSTSTKGGVLAFKIEILYNSPEDLERAASKPTVPIYSRLNGQDVESLSYTKLGNRKIVVSWIDPMSHKRYVRVYIPRPDQNLTVTTYNKRRSKITILVGGFYEQEVFENVRQ